jgi:hypothetical protein
MSLSFVADPAEPTEALLRSDLVRHAEFVIFTPRSQSPTGGRAVMAA